MKETNPVNSLNTYCRTVPIVIRGILKLHKTIGGSPGDVGAATEGLENEL